MDISDSLKETITVKSKSAYSSAGDPTYGAGVTMKARIERHRVRESGGEGTAFIDETRVFTLSAITQSDLVFFPEDSTGNNDNGRRPQRVEVMKDLDGVVSHYESIF